jgi:hypothetical protein
LPSTSLIQEAPPLPRREPLAGLPHSVMHCIENPLASPG